MKHTLNAILHLPSAISADLKPKMKSAVALASIRAIQQSVEPIRHTSLIQSGIETTICGGE